MYFLIFNFNSNITDNITDNIRIDQKNIISESFSDANSSVTMSEGGQNNVKKKKELTNKEKRALEKKKKQAAVEIEVHEEVYITTGRCDVVVK